MIIPGSFTSTPPEKGKPCWLSLRSLSATPDAWLLSSSSKVYRNEAKAIHPNAEEFFKQTKKLYLQALRFVGDYQFNDDLSLDPGDTVPFAYKIPSYECQLGPKDYFFDNFSADEIMDYLEPNPDSPLGPPGP